MSNTVLAEINTVLTGVYVLLTLIIAGATIWSLRMTRASLDLTHQQIDISKQQSQDAIVASERQSQAAIAAVYEQIKASEKQAQEALYNQHKPVIVPVGFPVSTDGITMIMSTENKGAGVALNTWGILSMVRGTLPSLSIQSSPMRYCAVQTYFLVTGIDSQMSFRIGDSLFPYEIEAFEGYSIYSENEDENVPVLYRLMITYNDAFNNKYLVVFDYSSKLGWRQVAEVKKVKLRLDELIMTKRSTGAVDKANDQRVIETTDIRHLINELTEEPHLT